MKPTLRIFISAFLMPCLMLSVPKTMSAQKGLKASKFTISPEVGLDFGAAIPIPPGAIGSEYKASPKMHGAYGVRFDVDYGKRHWGTSAAILYKTVELEADARVKNQKFKGEDIIQYATGLAHTDMMFSMVQLPLYATYSFGQNKRVEAMFGIYGAYLIKKRFNATTTKGFVGSEPDRVDSNVTEPVLMPFSSVLRSWDFGGLLGLSVNVWCGARASLSVEFGGGDIFERGSDFFDYSMHPLRGEFMLSFPLVRL